MTDAVPDPEEFVGVPPAGDTSPDEYTSNDQSAPISEETGTIYEPTGEPEVTPHDVELVAEPEDSV